MLQMVEQLPDVVLRHKGFPKGQNPAAFVEQSVDIPVPAGGSPQLPDPGGSRSSAVSREEAGHVFFSDFSKS